MRKFIIFFALGAITASLAWADDNSGATKRSLSYPYRRYVEVGVDAGVGFANNSLGLSDIFRKNIRINNEFLAKIKDNGLQFDFDVDATSFIKVNVSPNWGFDIRTSVEGSARFGLPQNIFTFLATGNLAPPHSFAGTIGVSGAVFAGLDTDIHWRLLKSKKLKVSVVPGVFVPLFYIPQSGFSYNLRADDRILMTIDGGFSVYTPHPLSNGSDDISEQGIFSAAGIDMSVSAEYDIFSWLSAGAGITHIPLIASTLQNRAYISFKGADGGPFTVIDSDNLIGSGAPVNRPTKFDIVNDRQTMKVRRPLRFEVFAALKPFKSPVFILRPTVGASLLNPDGKPHVNISLAAELNTRFFLMRFATAYEELLWKHSLLLGFDLRVFELDIGVDLRAQNLTRSLDFSGAGVRVGLRFGF